MVARQAGRLAGLAALSRILAAYDADLELALLRTDGAASATALKCGTMALSEISIQKGIATCTASAPAGRATGLAGSACSRGGCSSAACGPVGGPGGGIDFAAARCNSLPARQE